MKKIFSHSLAVGALLSLVSACTPPAPQPDELGDTKKYPNTGTQKDETSTDGEVQLMKAYLTQPLGEKIQETQESNESSETSEEQNKNKKPNKDDDQSAAPEDRDPITLDVGTPHEGRPLPPQAALSEDDQAGPAHQETPTTKVVPLWVRPSKLYVRSGPTSKHDILGNVVRGDKVHVIAFIENSEWVKIAIDSSLTFKDHKEKGALYVHGGYLTPHEQKPDEIEMADGNFPKNVSQTFMIQNIATETVRVYRRDCSETPCNNKLLFETEMVAGEDDSDTRTILGHFKITEWIKFYRDYAGNYPSWYDPALGLPPGPGSSMLRWTGFGFGKMRGAFGWYTAKVGPNASYQWTHGTLGWGADGKKFIRIPKEFFANLFSDPRSHGCSRFDNPTIALTRQLLPTGSTIIKVYAREALENPNTPKVREGKWEYILTKNGVRKDGQKASRKSTVLKDGTPRSQWLEEGTLTVDRNPDPTSGNLYDASRFHGIFYVDSGLLMDYRHPAGLRVGGVKGEHLLPEDVLYEKQR